MAGILLPAIATGIANLFGAFGAKKARDEANRQNQQKWNTYSNAWTQWRDAENARMAAMSRYATEQGWDERLGPLKAAMFAPIVGNAPGGGPPRVTGSFFNDFLGQTAGALPGLALAFKGPAPGAGNAMIGDVISRLFGAGSRGAPATTTPNFGGFSRTGWSPSYESSSDPAEAELDAIFRSGFGTHGG